MHSFVHDGWPEYPANATDAAVPADHFHRLVSAAARRTPGALAVTDGTLALDYGTLDSEADSLANWLHSLGAGPGSRVALLHERGAAGILAQLAVFKTGAACVLLDPEYPPARLELILADAQPLVTLTRRGLVERLPGGLEIALLDDPHSAWRSCAPVDPQGEVTDDSVCHIAYTSGSTGRPKAAMLRHGALRNLVWVLIREGGITADSRGTWLCSPGFGLVEVDCFPLLAAGASVHVPPQHLVADAERLRDWLVEQRISHSLWLTAMAERLWKLDWPADGALRQVRIAGERARSWPPADLPFTVVNVYGSAEATVSTLCDLTALARSLGPQGLAEHLPPIGQPCANVRAYVLDDRLLPVAAGEIGELFISGACLSAGYLNQQSITAGKFLPNHVPGDPHPVLYRTGDLARRWESGVLEVVGRTDDQVKVSGYRVQLGEVESAVAAYPGVLRAAVVAEPQQDGGTRLTGYVEPDPAAPPTLSALRRRLREELPWYMVPAVYVFVPAMPITANGKIDKAALPAPPRTRPELDTPFVAPADGAERELAHLWSQVLGLDGIGARDDFFELGGDSLGAMRLLAQIQEHTGLRLELSELYSAPTPESLARALADDRAPAADAQELAQIEPDPAAALETFPLTESQQALWIGRGDAVDYGNVGCHGYFEWENPNLDVERFRLAWARLIERHPMLRIRILPDGVQRVAERLEHDGITVVDLRELGPEAAAAQAERIRQEMSHQVLPVDRPPLYDVRLTRLPGGAVRIHFSLDMLVMDAWSIYQVFFPDLIDLYDDPRARLPEPGLEFRDYVLGRRKVLAGSQQWERSRAYWLDRLSTLPAAPDLPTVAEPDRPVQFERLEHALPAERWALLKGRGAARGVTPSGVLVAAFAEVLRRWSRDERFTVNFPVSDRLPLHPGVDRLVGDFTNTLLVAVEKTDGTFEERARDIQSRLWRDLEHRHFTGVEVLREITRRQGGGLTPAMPIVVTSLLGHPARRQSSALGRETYGVSQTPQVLLDFQIREIDGILHLKWDHLGALYPDGMIADMFAAFTRLLDELVDGAQSWHRERFDLLPAAQLALRERVNDTAAEVPEVLLDELLAERSRRDPEAVAVIAEDRTLTFGELDRLAGRIARTLRGRGFGRGDLIPVVMDKGWEQYAAVYGVLRAGAAYLPLDPNQPTSRLHALLGDGSAPLVLTQPAVAARTVWPEHVRVLSIDAELSAFAAEAEPPTFGRAASDRAVTDLAYVIYTSGSTGKPKGVMVDHRAVVNHITDIVGRLGLGPEDRQMATAALHFDMSVFDVFGILASGAAAVLPLPYTLPEPAAWLAVAQRHRVGFWAAVPQLMEVVVEHGLSTRAALPALRTVVLAGDWIPLALPDRIRALSPGARVHGSGGPTETVNWSVLYPIGEVDPRWSSIPYGRPLANQRYYILDDGLRPCPDWVPGQIVTASAIGLAQGYWNAPELTAERFVELDSGERAYLTGDLGRYWPDGDIEILGRTDFQIKVQGYRIEPGEIEAAILRQPGVSAAVVVAPASASGGRRLSGFYVGEGEPEAILRALRETLPGYMVPTDLRGLPELPLTGNGKVDRLALQALAAVSVLASAAEAEVDDGPADAVVELIAGLYAEVLGVPEAGVHADFFALGGDSLIATRLAGKLTESLGVDVGLRAVFSHSSPARLCRALAAEPENAPVFAALAELLAALDDGELAAL